MRRLFLVLLSIFVISSAFATIVPKPKEYKEKKGSFVIDQSTTIVFTDNSLEGVAEALSGSLAKITGKEVSIGSKGGKKRIELKLNSSLEPSSYQLEIKKSKIVLEAADFNTLALATSSILQLTNEKGVLPAVYIKDKPEFAWRTAMLDVARFWHPLESLYETVELLSYYKIPMLHFHLSDDQSVVFGTELYPKVLKNNSDGTPRYYTKQELRDLIEFARVRGVSIIPEIDLPAHSAPFWREYPEIFGAVDPETGKAVSLSAVNMTEERTYQALDRLIKEVTEVFTTTPYFHLGGDELWMVPNSKLPTYIPFCKEHNLQEALEGNTYEVYAYFLYRMDKIIRKHGKKTILWEGFNSDRAGSVKIPTDIPIIEWVTSFNSPQSLIEKGYKIVNGVWLPTYICKAMNFAPEQDEVYKWQHNLFRNHSETVEDLTLDIDQKDILGGQVSFWEQNYDVVVPLLRPNIPALSERLWSYDNNESYQSFKARYEVADKKLKKILRPLNIKATSGLLSKNDINFTDKITIEIENLLDGEIKYTIADHWYNISDDCKTAYSGPITLNKTAIITAQLFDKNGEKVGYPERIMYQKIEPIFTYKAYRGAPQKGWKSMPDIDTLPIVKEGYFGKIDAPRIKEIRRELFYGVEEEGHIDTRPTWLMNPFALRMEATFVAPVSGKYRFKVKNQDGLYTLKIGDQKVAGTKFGYEEENFEIELQKGENLVVIDYFYKEIQNILNIKVAAPGENQFQSFQNYLEAIK